ncbi:MAG: cytochrome c peroxidase [Elusimicrobiota bacterium]
MKLSYILALVLTAAATAEEAPPGMVLRGHTDDVSAAVFTPDGAAILSVGGDDTLRLWDAATGASRAVWKAPEGEADDLAITPDGRTALLAGADGALVLWDLTAGRRLAALTGHKEHIRSIALSPDGRHAATTSFAGDLILWDITARKLLAVLHPGPGAGAVSAAFSPDGRKLVTGMWHKVIWVWDVARRARIAEWPGHQARVLAVAFSPDGSRVLSSGRDNTVRLWDAESGQQLGAWKGHAGSVNDVTFSPDGNRALSAGADGTLRLWDAATGRELAVWRGHQAPVLEAAFSPDGKRAVSASEDGTVRLWGDAQSPERSAGEYAAPDDEAGLGRLLFFDRRLSGNSGISCATCHIPEQAYSDGLALSAGYPDTRYFRNTPTLLNIAGQKNLYWDGRFSSADLPSLMRDHISEAHFMNADGRLIVEKLRQAPGYVRAFQKVYGSEPSYSRLLDALGAYVRSLQSAPARYDLYLRGDPTALPAAARRGLALFTGEAGCARCHRGPLLTDDSLHARQVPENPEILKDPLRSITFRRFFKLLGVENYQQLKQDVGLYAVSKQPRDRGRFKTPSLREVARTAPYMHNGICETLDEAVAFENPNLSKRQRRDIVAFLETLSSETPPAAAPSLPEYALLKLARERPAARPQPAGGAKQAPPLAPLPPVPVPEDNPLTPVKIELGIRLFHDPRLSGDGHTRCITCHEPAMGWGDGSALAQGHPGTLHWRNAQTLLNAAYHTRLEWDGAWPSLEEQARHAITSNLNGNGDPVMIEERLAQSPGYVELFRRAFGVERPNFEGVLKALASFFRGVLVSKNVPFDNYARGDAAALDAAARRGLTLFQGKAGCLRCHNGPLVSDGEFHATGVPRSAAFDEVPLRQVALRYQHAVRGAPEEMYRAAGSDPGLYFMTRRELDIGKFRTPSLRELKYTAPYMHNGVFNSLAEVVDFYDRGGGEAANKTPLLRPLSLTPGEKRDLIAFLESLSGDEIAVGYPITLGPYYAPAEEP